MAPATRRPLHFLLATDRSPGAVDHLALAIEIGNALGAHATLFHAVIPHQPLVNADAAPADIPAVETADEVRSSLTAITGTLAADRPIAVDVEVDGVTDAKTAVLAAANRLDADLIVLPTHGRTGLSRAVLGSTAEQILRRSNLPVLLLTDRMLEHALSPAERGPIMLATDLSPAARVAHAPASRLAHRLGLPLHILSVLPAEQPLDDEDEPVTARQPDARVRIDRWQQRLRAVATELGLRDNAEVEARIDKNVPGTIVAVANSRQASLLVLATHGRRGVARMIEGSVAEWVVRHATVPVVCMPAHRE